MIDLTGYTMLKALTEAGSVRRSTLKSFLIKLLPVEAGVVANASSAEVDAEIESVIAIINTLAGECVVAEDEDVITLRADNPKCLETVKQLVNRYEALSDISCVSLLGKHISLVRPYVEQYVRTLGG